MVRTLLKKVGERLKPGQICVPDIEGRRGAVSAEGSQDAIFDVFPYLTGRYPHRDKRKVFFAVSSGLCNLSCPYCITNRPRLREYLDKDDFAFIFEYFGENIYFGFSGLGDFFCGYSRKDQLLRYLLQHDVMLFLDINGVEIHELGDPDLEHRERIGKINVSYHYGTMKKQKLVGRWVDSIRKIQEHTFNYDLKMVCSPLEKDIIEEALLFYRKEVQPITNQKLILAPDGLFDLKSQMEDISRTLERYGDVIDFSGEEAMYREKVLPPAAALPCPAGSRYFRVFHNGNVIPCELFGTRMHVSLGNVKKKQMSAFRKDVLCNYSGFCDCFSATNPATGLVDDKGRPYPPRER
ncbi:MAG TPA: SPASM domain-containing protein [Dissulfurispiraceae bacterium]